MRLDNHTQQIVTSSINASSPLLSGMKALIEEVKGERSERRSEVALIEEVKGERSERRGEIASIEEVTM